MTRPGIARVVVIAFVFALAAGAVRPAGRQGQQTPPPARTLAAGAASVSVDFIALNRDGRPVLDLRPEEITLKVDGKARALRSLTLMAVGAGADESTAPLSEPPPAPFATNDVADGGRAFVLMIDDESLRVGSEQPVRDAVSHFLTGLSSRDRVAVITLPHGGLKVDFTNDHAKVRQALMLVTGRAVDRETMADASIRTRTTLQQLSGWIDNLGGGQGPTTVVLFSSSLMGVRGQMASAGATRGGGQVGLDNIRQEDFQIVGDSVAAARVQFYVVQHDQIVAASQAVLGTTASGQPAASTSAVDMNSTRAGLENLTGVTGGTMLSLAGSNGETALTRIARETAAYWSATFDAESNERNGINHPLSLKTSRDGVSIHVRPTVPIAKVDASAARPTPTTPHAMLLESRMHRELLLRVAGYASRNSADGQIKIIAVAETVDSGVAFAAAEAALFDDGGHMLKQWAPATAELGRNRIVGAFSGIPKGHYRLRVAATDAEGHRGTADYDVAAELAPAGTITLSDVALGLSRDGQFAPRLQFSAEPVALAYFDIYYTGQAGARAIVMLEVAQTLNGPPFLRIQPAVDATSELDRFNVTAAIPLGTLPTGDYVIRAIVGAEGQPAGRVVRTLRKVAR